jgi:hypothetical protein
MNQDQLINLIQSIGKVGGGIAAGYGASATNLWAAFIGLAVAVAGFYYSHKSNAAPPLPPPATDTRP